MSQQRVAIIGAGPSGLSALRALSTLASHGTIELVCFERQADIGGQWIYSWQTGVDERGEPVPGSMYRDLYALGGKEVAEYHDYSYEEHFGKPIGSYPPRAVILDYLRGRARQTNAKRFVQLQTAVRSVSFQDGSYQVDVQSLSSDNTAPLVRHRFDYVVVATGHFSVPNHSDVAQVKGIGEFRGRILHSHDFRNADEFRGQRVLVIGMGVSGMDIAMQLFKYGAEAVAVSMRRGRGLPVAFPPTVVECRPRVVEISADGASFEDGSRDRFHAIILCTGYRYRLPFFDGSPDLAIGESIENYPPGLYKGVVWAHRPTLFYVDAQRQYFHFNKADLQARLISQVIGGEIELPSYDDMKADMEIWQRLEVAKRGTLPSQVHFQRDYMNDLRRLTKFKPSVDATEQYLQTFESAKHSLVTHRDGALRSIVTGKLAPISPVSWMDMYDYSLEAYLALF